MSGFVKIYGTILDSSIWSADPYTRVVWITMLAMADRKGLVAASDDGIARRANVPEEQCAIALLELQSPDPKSKSKANRGRRLRRVNGGYLILNYKHYREMRTADQIAEAERKQRYRNSKRDNGESVGHVPPVPGSPSASPHIAEAEAEAEKGPSARARAKNDNSAEAAWDEILTVVSVGDPKHIDGARLSALFDRDERARYALRAIGGHMAVKNTPAEKRVWLRRDFLKAYDQAEAA